MKLCYFCGKNVNGKITVESFNLCKQCKAKLINHYGIKCVTCGAWGFIRIIPVNMLRLAGIGIEPEGNIVNLNYCSNCTE